jgi:hypothetical protein
MKKNNEESKVQEQEQDVNRLKVIQKQNKYDIKFLNAVAACVSCKGAVVNIKQVEKLTNKGADVNSFNHAGETALTIVLAADEPLKENLLTYLLSIDYIDVNSFGDDPSKTTPLMRAVELENHEQGLRVCKMLIEKGAICEDFRDAIESAAFAENYDLAEFLEQQLLGQDS